MSADTHDAPKRDELLDHDADGIREFDNALPRWWLYGFYFTIAFAAVYLINYHVLPKPLFGYTTIAAEWAADVDGAKKANLLRPHAMVSIDKPLTDPDSLAK